MENKIKKIAYLLMIAIVIIGIPAMAWSDPTCEVRVKDQGPPKVVEFIFQESQVGLKSITVKSYTNVTFNVPAFYQGYTGPITVTVTQKNTNLEFNAVIEAKDMENRATTFQYPGTEPPQCGVSNIDPGPPYTVSFSIVDSTEGLKSISVEESVNADVNIPSFTVGTTQEVIVEVQKIDPFGDFSVTLAVSDLNGNEGTCEYSQPAQPDTEDPQLIQTAMDTGPPIQLEITARDNESGMQSINIIKAENADVQIASFTAGTNDPIIITADQINESLQFAVEIEAVDKSGNKTSYQYEAAPDNQNPQLIQTAIDTGPPIQLEITARDNESGMQTINVIKSENADVQIASFTAGTNDPIIITADQINKNLQFAVEIEAVDRSGNKTSYQYEAAPDNQNPQLIQTAINTGPPSHLEITARDNESGMQSINVINSENVNVQIASFTVGTNDPIIITADQINENLQFAVEIEAVDRNGNKASYQYETSNMKTRPEIDLVGQDSQYFFRDDWINQIFTNGKDNYGTRINDFSAFQSESFTSTAGQETPDTCYSTTGHSYESILTPTWTDAEYTWEIVLQMKPATDLVLKLNGCVLKTGSNDVWSDGYQTGFYTLPWDTTQAEFLSGANPRLTVQALPGPMAKEGFPPGGFTLDTRRQSGLQVAPLDDSLVTIQSLAGENIVIVLPVEGRINATGQTMHSLSQGDRIIVIVSLPGNTTPDVRFGASGSALQYIGLKGTEYLNSN